LGEASARLFTELNREIDVRYEHLGRLEVCRGEACFRAACEEAALLEEFGFVSRRLRGSEVREFEPAVAGDVAGAVYYPNSGYCNPQTFVLRLAEAAQRRGATLRTATCVTGLRVERARVVSVRCGNEQFEADAFVLACGSWAPQLAGPLGVALPVQPGKGYHVDVDRPAQCPRVPIVLLEERIFVSPLDDFLRLAGTMEFSGFNLRPRPERWEMLPAGASRYFPELARCPIRSRWCHLRPMTADGLPIIGRLPRLENAWIATGHGMLGFTQGPITGQLLAEWITEGKPSLDLTDVRADRF
jgi:D-amino-acid dehydrogenase